MTNDSRHPDLEAAAARARRLLALLRELSETGMELARGLSSELTQGARASDLALRYCRIANAVCRLVALEARLAQAFDDVAGGRWDAEEAARELRALTVEASQDTALEAIEQAVRASGDKEAVTRLSERLHDWHAERSIERDFTGKSVAEIVVSVCNDLGLAPDPALLSQESMAQTLADAVRAYAAALKAAPQGAPHPHLGQASWPPPAVRRAAFAEPRGPPN